MADAGEVMAGRIGREIFGAAQMLFLVFIMGSHILNTLTNYGTCTIIFAVLGTVVSLLLSLPRTLHEVSYMAVAGFVSIFAAVLITMIGVTIEKPGNGLVQVTNHTGFQLVFLVFMNIIFAYSDKNNFTPRLYF